MKKWVLGAIAVWLCGCYTPLNNSGVSTTKPWLEVPAKRVDFDGKQYDSCVQFQLRFWPQEAAERIDLQKACISACCWRSEQDEITLDFNSNFEQELAQYGVARQYTPGKITLRVTHSNLVNVTKVTVAPRGAINNSGLVKLSYKTLEDKARLAQLAQQRNLQTKEPSVFPVERPVKLVKTTRQVVTPVDNAARAKELVQQKWGIQIDKYFHQMNKTYQQQGAIFMLSSRLLVPRLQEDGTYLVMCHAKARTGIDEAHLNSSDFPCGVWVTDIQAQQVFAQDAKARSIAQL